MLRRHTAQQIADRIINYGVGLMILAEHFKINAHRRPAHTEIRLPLQLHLAAGDGQRCLGAIFIEECDRSGFGIDRLHWYIEHAACSGRDWQEGRISRLALWAQGGEHDGHDLIKFFKRVQQHFIKLAGLIIISRRGKLIGETERVKKATEHRVVVVPEAFIISAKWIGH